MKREIKFQRRMMDLFDKESGVQSFHLSPTSHPGFFDVTTFLPNERVMKIECKDITGDTDRSLIKSAFTDNQLPFYARWFMTGPATKVYIVLNDGEEYIDIVLESLRDVISLREKSTGFVRSTYLRYTLPNYVALMMGRHR